MSLPSTRTLLAWYDRHGRELPWRTTRDAYRIWISEIILQQTRVAQGTEYYLRFVARFPDPASLAAASEDEVLKLWQGLGYYSRARNLHAAARTIVREFGGRFPRRYDDVRALRGVGDYTAAAICSAAYDEPVAAIDGNVYRVVTRLFDLAEPIDTAAGRRTVARLAREMLDTQRPGDFNQAMMDFGALCCTPRNPACVECPLRFDCRARTAGSVAERPVKRGRTTVRDRYLNYLDLCCGGEFLLQRRPAGDIWQGLYDLPLIECDRLLTAAELAADARFGSLTAGCDPRIEGIVTPPPHQLSHQRLHARFFRIVLARWNDTLREMGPIPRTTRDERAVPRLLERYFEAESRQATTSAPCSSAQATNP